jgi:hypothetical protein
MAGEAQVFLAILFIGYKNALKSTLLPFEQLQAFH